MAVDDDFLGCQETQVMKTPKMKKAFLIRLVIQLLILLFDPSGSASTDPLSHQTHELYCHRFIGLKTIDQDGRYEFEII